MIDFSKIPAGYVDRNRLVKSKKPVITIITPFYNAGDTMIQTVDSVLNQTYPHFEWIIVDDGSKDKTSLNRLEKVSKMDGRIRVFHKENSGPSQARDFGISKASKETKYIYFLDADDIIDKTMIECLYWALETHIDASFAYTTMVNFGAREFIWNKYLTIERQKQENLICISSMVRKNDLLEVGGFEIKEKAMYEDWYLWLKLIAAGKKPLRINAPLFWYRTSNTGELSRAKENNESAMKYVKQAASKIKEEVEIIQYPRIGKLEDSCFKWENITYPQYKKDDKKTIMFLIPWMLLGGADMFNLDILKRIDKDKFNTIIITMLPSNNPLRQEFEEYATEVFDLSTFLDVCDYPSFINCMIKSRNVTNIFISNCSYAYAMLPIIKKEYPNIPVIDYVHSVDPRAERGGFGGFSRDLDKFIDMTYTCNNFTTKQMKEDFNKKSVETLYIGTDQDQFNPSKYNKNKLKNKYNIPKDKYVVSYIARFSEEKRPILFAQIAKNILKKRNDFVFVMAGFGNLFNEVKSNISKHGLKDNIILLGSIDIPEEIYAISDVTVNCSRLEGLALTSFESLSMGVPVVSADVGGQRELIDDQVGKIIPFNENISLEDEVKSYSEGIIETIGNLSRLKKNARKKINDKFNLNNTIKSFEKNILNIKAKDISHDLDGMLIYELYLRILLPDYKWCCHEYMLENYGVSLYENSEEDGFNLAKKQKLKRKLASLCSRFNIKYEVLTLLNFSRNIITFLKSFMYIFILGFRSLIAIFKVFGKLSIKVLKSYKKH